MSAGNKSRLDSRQIRRGSPSEKIDNKPQSEAERHRDEGLTQIWGRALEELKAEQHSDIEMSDASYSDIGTVPPSPTSVSTTSFLPTTSQEQKRLRPSARELEQQKPGSERDRQIQGMYDDWVKSAIKHENNTHVDKTIVKDKESDEYKWEITSSPAIHQNVDDIAQSLQDNKARREGVIRALQKVGAHEHASIIQSTHTAHISQKESTKGRSM